MLDNVLETIGTTFITIFIMSGAGFVMWWGVESTKRFCNKESCCSKSEKINTEK